MKAPIQIPKPRNWQDFEELCLRIFRADWDCRTAKKNGRIGQAQNGVDIYGIPKNETDYSGVQCKGKNEWNNSVLTESEIVSEINKAKDFQPALGSFIIATISNKDAKLEKIEREKNIELLKQSCFSFTIYFWEDLASLIEQHKSVYDWYVCDKMQIFEPDIEILINGEPGLESSPVIIKPEYLKYRKIRKYIQPDPFTFNYADIMSDLPVLPSSSPEGNSPVIHFKVVNNGDVLENCVFSISIEKSNKRKFFSYMPTWNTPFDVEDYHLKTKAEFTLHSQDSKTFYHEIEFEIIPPEEEIFTVNWKFTSKQNRKPYAGSIYCKVVPTIINGELDFKTTTVKSKECDIEVIEPKHR